LLVENEALRAENHRQKQKRAQRRQNVGRGGTLTVQSVQDTLIDNEVQAQLEGEVRSARITRPVDQQEGHRERALPRCSKCRSLEHTARSCNQTL
jgi:hypothetical protein